MACSKTHHASPRLLLALALVLLAIQLEHPSHALSSNTSSTIHVRARCHRQQAAALLHLKRSFSFAPSSCREYSARTELSSWREGTDCCHWEGIGCDRISGRVTTLNLSRQVIKINGFHPALFNLTSLKYLNLEENEFCGSHPPASGFERLTQLQVLRLSGCNLSGTIPPSLSTLNSLKTIDLSENNLTGPVPDMFSNFPLLETLVLAANPFESGTLPLGITQLKNLKVLNLHDMNLFGVIPLSIGNLSSLRELYLDWNSFIGGLPWSLNNLTYLTMLSCDDSGLSGRVPSFTSLNRLESISLSNNNLTGSVPLFHEGTIYPNLTEVDLSNNSLSGTIPATLFTRSALQKLSLQMNYFSGPIGEFHNPSSTLTEVDLSSNHLSGAVPISFSKLTALNTLVLDSNNFTGLLDLIPYFRQRNLKLTASYNRFLSATAEDHGSNATCINGSIHWLELKGCSLTSIPSALRYLPELTGLDLSYNRIGGRTPDWILRSMNTLILSHNKFTTVGQIPDNTTIAFLDLSFNKLRGAVPFPSVGYTLDYSNNEFSSIPPNNFLHLIKVANYINLANNKLSGPLPYAESHWNITSLMFLDLSGNNLSGLIPPFLLKDWNHLDVLNLRGNSLSGTWPESMDKLCNLMIVDLHGNHLEGPLPRSLANCNDLEDLDVGGNNFVDVFPTCLGKLPGLRLLVMRSNKFYGPVNIPIWKNHSNASYFDSIQIIDLAGNGFTGVIPSELFDSFKWMVGGQNYAVYGVYDEFDDLYQVEVDVKMKQQYMKLLEVYSDLVVIDLSNNRFSGPIPKTVGNLTALLVLNMSHNALTGGIPDELGRLTRVESLDLSWNHLTGEIPRELVALTALDWLSLSYNDLSGSIPSGSQFSTFPSSSFQGNPRLYGCPLPVRCNLTQLPPPPPQVTNEASASHSFELIVLWLLVGSGYGLGFALAVVLYGVCTGRPKKMTRDN